MNTATMTETMTLTLTVDQCKRMVAVWKAGHDDRVHSGKFGCLSFISTGSKLTIAATNGHLLVEEDITPDEFTFEAFSVIITGVAIVDLAQWLKTAPKQRGKPVDVLFAMDAKHIVVAGWNSSISLALYDGTYPDVSIAYGGEPCTMENGCAKPFALNLEYLAKLSACWDGAPCRFTAGRGMMIQPLNLSKHRGCRALLMPISLPK